jgi:hypothetical protein
MRNDGGKWLGEQRWKKDKGRMIKMDKAIRVEEDVGMKVGIG